MYILSTKEKLIFLDLANLYIITILYTGLTRVVKSKMNKDDNLDGFSL